MGTYRRDRAASRPPPHVELGFRSRAALRASWLSPDGVRDLHRWAAEFPGWRPRGWWYAVAPEPRRHLGNGRYESQAACLLRLGLLLPGERERVDRVFFAPVTKDIDPTLEFVDV